MDLIRLRCSLQQQISTVFFSTLHIVCNADNDFFCSVLKRSHSNFIVSKPNVTEANVAVKEHLTTATSVTLPLHEVAWQLDIAYDVHQYVLLLEEEFAYRRTANIKARGSKGNSIDIVGEYELFSPIKLELSKIGLLRCVFDFSSLHSQLLTTYQLLLN